MRISVPFNGLRRARDLRFLGRKVPKPTTVTRLPLATVATIASNTAFTASPALDLLKLPALAAASTRSALVTDRMALFSPLRANERNHNQIAARIQRQSSAQRSARR